MIKRIAASAAFLALAAAPIQAQTFPDPVAAGANLGGTPGGTGTTQPFFIGGTPFQFVPGTGFVPQGAVPFNNGFAFGDPFGVNGGFTSGFNNGFGTSFAPGFGGGFGFNPFFFGSTGPYSFNQGALRTTPSLMVGGAVPPIWNAAVAANRARAAANGTSRRPARARTASPRIPTEVAAAPGTRFEREMVAGSRQETISGAVTMSKAEKEDELRASHRIETLMRNRPITEGELIRLGATGAQVRISTNGDVRTERYPIENVFFFAEDGRLVTALQAPDEVTPGARVLVPIPAGENTVTMTPVIGSIVTDRVAGSRQSTAKKSPAKKTTKKSVKAKKRK